MTEAQTQKVRKIGHLYHVLRNAFYAAVLTVAIAILSVNVIVLQETRSNTQTLVNCTTPQHTCYEQARSATSGAVGTIDKIIILAAFCVKNLDHGATQLQIETCVNAGLK